MRSIHKFLIKVAFLIVPFAILTIILLDDTGNGGIGGGGYDLSGLVYGSALFAVIILWMLVMLIGYFTAKTTANRKLQLWLLAVGAGTLLAAWLVTEGVG